MRGGGRTYVAAVARETLAEAEGFAAEHRFNPVCFAAVPDPFTYMGEAFFGPTQVAPSLIGPGQSAKMNDDHEAVFILEKPLVIDGLTPLEIKLAHELNEKDLWPIRNFKSVRLC